MLQLLEHVVSVDAGNAGRQFDAVEKVLGEPLELTSKVIHNVVAVGLELVATHGILN
jgi:hypothetical protein